MEGLVVIPLSVPEPVAQVLAGNAVFLTLVAVGAAVGAHLARTSDKAHDLH